jgi:hypothetical protein
MENERMFLEDKIWGGLTFTEDLVNEKTGETRMKVWGVVQEADVLNKNKRVYPYEVLNIAKEGLKARAKEGKVFGEVDHPVLDGKLKEVSHRVTDVWWDKENPKKLMAEFLVLNTPSGQIIKEIIRSGGKPGFSSRGNGKALPADWEGEKAEKIEPGFEINSFDFVIDPSVSGAQITKIMESAKAQSSTIMEEKMDKEEKKLTLESLKQEHPDLVQQIIDETKATLTAQFDEQKQKIDERVVTLERELGEKDAELETHLVSVAAIIDVLKEKGYLVVPKTEQTDKKVDVSAFESKINELTGAKTQLEEELKTTKEKLTVFEAEKKTLEIANAINEITSSHKFGKLLKAKLEEANLQSKEAVTEAFENYKTLVEAITSDESSVLTGKGRQKEEVDSNKLTESELQKAVRARAGLHTIKE